jgi:predicted acyltransferase
MKDRLVSLDVFRGLTIASMILVNNPGAGATTYAPLLHAAWDGWTFTDTVFPFFLWIAGVAMTFSFAKRAANPAAAKGPLMLHSLKRAASIFAVGLLLNGFPYFDLSTLRIPGVLQRIAVCYLIAAAILLYTGVRGCAVAIPALFAVYWVLMTLVPVPGFGPGVLTREGNFSGYVDRIFLTGHMYSQTKTWDPEGIVSTLPAIASVLFGILTGAWLRGNREGGSKTVGMLASGGLLIAAGYVMNVWMPFNKNLWTPSYTALMAGLALAVFGVCYWIIDVKGIALWSRPFAIYGSNAIVLYALSGLLARMLGILRIGGATLKTAVYQTVFVPLASPYNASLLFALSNVAVIYLAAWFLYRKQWFVRL